MGSRLKKTERWENKRHIQVQRSFPLWLENRVNEGGFLELGVKYTGRQFDVMARTKIWN